MQFEVGDGTRVLFWYDVWCEKLPLKILFSSIILYCLRKRGMGGGEYGYSTWYYSLECYVFSTCSLLENGSGFTIFRVTVFPTN